MKLTAAQRDALPTSSFALPGRRMFPIHDSIHAEKALQLVGRALKAGSITAEEASTVRRKARGALNRHNR
jgi:hypothetical protein